MAEMELSMKIRKWLYENKFILFCQKIEPVDPNKCNHYEVLVRVMDDDTIISPAIFLKTAIDYDIIADIDFWVIERAFKFISNLIENSDGCLYSINLSSKTILKTEFIDKIRSFMTAYKTKPYSIAFEITESTLFTDPEIAIKTISKLRELGFRISLDDFGSEASNISRLQTIIVDYIKIDGTFIRDIIGNRFDELVVKFVIDIAKILNVSVIAEFVHNQNIKERLKLMGVDYLQGYAIHKPLPLCCITKKERIQVQLQ